jgi:hypothetical protein
MGFKSMSKMDTTQPSVDEAGKGMKKGGKTKMAMGGSPLAAAAAAQPMGRRPMPSRKPNPRAAMMEAAMAEQAAARPMMRKKGGEVESKATHAKEMQGLKGIKKELKSHEGKPASKAHKGLKMGGMPKYATGGIVQKYATGGVVQKFADGGHAKMSCSGGDGYKAMKKGGSF